MAAMVDKNSKKVNDKQKKRKETKEELTKDRTWKIIGAFANACLNCLETKSENRRKRKEDVDRVKQNVLKKKNNLQEE